MTNRIEPPAPTSSQTRFTKWVGWLLLLLGLFLPAAWIAWRDLGSPNFWFDESGQYWLSRGLHHFSAPLSVNGGWDRIVEYGRIFNSDPGGFTLLLRAVIITLGSSPVALRSLPFFFYLLTAGLLVLSARRAGTPWPWASLTGVLPGGFAALVHYSTELRAYSMESAAVVWLCFCPLWLKDTTPLWRWLAVGCAGALLTSSRYSAFFFAVAAGIAVWPRPVFSRASLARCLLYGSPFVALACAAYWYFARLQAGGTHRPPAYVVDFLLAGKNPSQIKSLLYGNFLLPPAWPITGFLVFTPLFLRFTPACLRDLRSVATRIYLFVLLSVVFTATGSAAGKLPWAITTRWSIGYLTLSACCLAMGIIVLGVWISRSPLALRFPRATALLAVLPAAAWAIPQYHALAVPRVYYETLATQLETYSQNPHSHPLRIYVAGGASPTVRYLAESGPLQGKFNYPTSFHFETGEETTAAARISAKDFDVIVLTHFSLAPAYQKRVTDGTFELHMDPGPSCLLVLKSSP